MTSKKIIKKTLLISASVCSLLVMILVVHIYIVTRPKPIDPYTVAMARMDIKQDISIEDASKITAGLYKQNGVDHVLCNPKTHIAVFTYFPAKTNAGQVIRAFKSQTDYKVEQFLPGMADLQSGCPVMSNHSLTYKVFSFFKHIF